jgi:hypothetical protein
MTEFDFSSEFFQNKKPHLSGCGLSPLALTVMYEGEHPSPPDDWDAPK